MENFGGLGEGRLLGRLPGDGDDTMAMTPKQTTDVLTATVQAEELATAGETPVVVPYRTPTERANDSLIRNAKGTAAAILVVVGPIFVAFLSAGNFGPAAWAALGTAVGTALVILAVDWALKYREANAEDRGA